MTFEQIQARLGARLLASERQHAPLRRIVIEPAPYSNPAPTEPHDDDLAPTTEFEAAHVADADAQQVAEVDAAHDADGAYEADAAGEPLADTDAGQQPDLASGHVPEFEQYVSDADQGSLADADPAHHFAVASEPSAAPAPAQPLEIDPAPQHETAAAYEPDAFPASQPDPAVEREPATTWVPQGAYPAPSTSRQPWMEAVQHVGTGARRVPAIAVSMLHGALFLTILGSFLVFVEPSPYEVLSALLAFTCLLAGVTLDRKLLPLIFLLLIYNVGGAFSLIPVISDDAARRFILISFYMAFTAIIFAMIVSKQSARRMEILRRAYIVAGLAAAVAGIVGYFYNIDILTLYTRARGTFKDPNVFGPFLILPMLFLLQSFLARGLRIVSLAVFMVMAAGLFLSFSRAAWAHMVFSAVMMMVLLFVTSSSGWFRARMIVFAVMGTLAMAGGLIGLLAVGNVGTVFKERASLNQYYDTGESGRFGNQKKSVTELLDRPNGFGPLQFRNHYTNDPHQVYLNAFASYGWIGGFSYLALVIITLAIGLRNVFVATPWQRYFIPVMATYTGVAVEGLVIDTDHWRHYYLLLGLVWGLSIATMNYRRKTSVQTYVPAYPPQAYAYAA